MPAGAAAAQQVVATDEELNGRALILINETNRTQTAQVEIASLRECAFNVSRASHPPDIDNASHAVLMKRSVCPSAALHRLYPYRRARCREDELLVLNATSRFIAAKRLRFPHGLK